MSAAAGYSGKALAAKLGAKAEQTWLVIAPPENHATLMAEGPQPLDMRRAASAGRAGKGPFDVVHIFCADSAALGRGLAPSLDRLAPGGFIWVSWPKKTSRLFRDLTEDGIRASAFPLGLVDVKVCAVDDDWSGLKLMRRSGGKR